MNLPVNAKNTQAALLTLAIVKNFKTHLDRAEKNAKNYLAKAMIEGQALKAFSEDGDELATVSRTREGAPTWVVTAPEEFVSWCQERGIDHGGVRTWTFPKEATSTEVIDAYIAEHGQVPAGLTSKPGRVSTIATKQSPTQAEAITALFPGTKTLLKAIRSQG